MAELLIKIGDNFPHKDLMLSLKSTDADAKQAWIEREAQKSYIAQRVDKLGLALTTDNLIDEASARWEESKYCYRHGEIIKIRPDGWEWGSRESYPRFYIVRVPDSQLDLLGYRHEGTQPQIRSMIEPYWMPDQDRLVVEYDDLAKKNVSHLAPLYFHRRKLWMPDIDKIAKPDSIVEMVTTSSIQARESGYEDYDTAKAVEHNSAGTFAIRSSGGDYTDLSDWDAGEACDLTADGGQGLSIADCYDDWAGGLDDYVDLNTDWTADSDNYPKITVHEGNRHNGTAESGFFLKNTASTNYKFAIVRCAKAYIEYIESQATSSQNNSYFVYSVSNTYDVLIENCIVHNYVDSIGGTALFYFAASFVVKNSLFYDLGQYNYIDGFNGCKFYNCTFASLSGEQWGRYGDYDILLRDSYAYNCVVWNGESGHTTYGTCYVMEGGDYNCTDDASGPGGNSLDNKTLNDIDWVNDTAGSEDFNLGGSSCLKAAGYAYDDMMEDDIQPIPWHTIPSIGCFEYDYSPTTGEWVRDLNA